MDLNRGNVERENLIKEVFDLKSQLHDIGSQMLEQAEDLTKMQR